MKNNDGAAVLVLGGQPKDGSLLRTMTEYKAALDAGRNADLFGDDTRREATYPATRCRSEHWLRTSFLAAHTRAAFNTATSAERTCHDQATEPRDYLSRGCSLR
jgi:hypothetical protein